MAAATGILSFLICATLATSRNWFHDGADTGVARWLSVVWEWSFFVAAPFQATGWGYFGMVLLLPLLVYTAGFFIAFSITAAFRTPPPESTQTQGAACQAAASNPCQPLCRGDFP
jgi:hypothetical protein